MKYDMQLLIMDETGTVLEIIKIHGKSLSDFLIQNRKLNSELKIRGNKTNVSQNLITTRRLE